MREQEELTAARTTRFDRPPRAPGEKFVPRHMREREAEEEARGAHEDRVAQLKARAPAATLEPGGKFVPRFMKEKEQAGSRSPTLPDPPYFKDSGTRRPSRPTTFWTFLIYSTLKIGPHKFLVIYPSFS
jgi:hypothetical protein